MSDFRVLQAISRYLRQLLFDGLSEADVAEGSFTSINNISLASPPRIADKSAPDASHALLSLYLYRVSPNAHLNNRPPIPAGPGQQHYPPLSLDLSYLLTPLSKSPEHNLVTLGRSMQILDAHPIIRANFLDSLLRPAHPKVGVTINPVTLEELTRIWNAFNEPYRLSVCYKVQVVSIDSDRAPEEGPPVAERLLDVHQITGRGGAP